MVMEALGALQKALLSVGKGILDAVPGLLGAIVLLLIGYWIALAVEWAVERGLGKLKADEYLVKKTGLNKSLGNLSVEWLAGLLAKWYVFVLF
ncbi:hypothetical protein HY837_04140, partial [archaeon]|nr:hypothetical protein [archaeon]